MKLVAFTICLDGEPFIERHLPTLQKTNLDWQWIVIEGASGNTADTSWCKEQEPRLSEDGTHEYLCSIKDERIIHIFSPSWSNKTEMCNAALERIKEPCCLMQCDHDELWKSWQLERIVRAFEMYPDLDSMQFRCRYFVGGNLILQGEHCYGDMDYEWWRTWRYTPGQRWISHEPPILEGSRQCPILKESNTAAELVFNHMAYATEAQVKFKQDWYGINGEYDGLLEGWRRLQEVKDFPVKLSDYFPQVKGDLPLVVKI